MLIDNSWFFNTHTPAPHKNGTVIILCNVINGCNTQIKYTLKSKWIVCNTSNASLPLFTTKSWMQMFHLGKIVLCIINRFTRQHFWQETTPTTSRPLNQNNTSIYSVEVDDSFNSKGKVSSHDAIIQTERLKQKNYQKLVIRMIKPHRPNREL